MFGAGALGLTVLLVNQWTVSEWWADLGLTMIVICFLFAWPKTIMTGELGIECSWWWRRKIFIPWEQVEDIETGTAGARDYWHRCDD
jgi:hypothetical protein